MDNQRLKETLRPLAKAFAPNKSLNAQRHAIEGFRDDGGIEDRLVVRAMPLQRLDWVIPPGEPAGVQVARYHVPMNAGVRRLVMVATTVVSSSLGVDVLVGGVVRGSGTLATGEPSMNANLTIDIPAGSTVGITTNSSIPQGVTVSIFYRPTED